MPRTEPEIELLNQAATETGRVVIEWNDMCESFGSLFGSVLYPNAPVPKIAWAIWHSTINDRAQRDMLLAAAMAARDEAGIVHPSFYSDIEWLCQRAQALSDQRNNVVHAPLTFELGQNDASVPLRVVPMTFFGHPRAIRLDGRNLLQEFKKYTRYAESLKLFARNIEAAIRFASVHPWPDRPQLPNLRESRS